MRSTLGGAHSGRQFRVPPALDGEALPTLILSILKGDVGSGRGPEPRTDAGRMEDRVAVHGDARRAPGRRVAFGRDPPCRLFRTGGTASWSARGSLSSTGGSEE